MLIDLAIRHRTYFPTTLCSCIARTHFHTPRQVDLICVPLTWNMFMVAACCRPGYLCSSWILMVDALVTITAITAMRSWALLQRRWAGMAQWAWGLHGQVQLVPGQVRGLCCTARLSLATCMLRALSRLSLKKGQNRSYPIYFILFQWFI
jgi:hypothetical protein